VNLSFSIIIIISQWVEQIGNGVKKHQYFNAGGAYKGIAIPID
jgi:hypothetical protein